MNIKHSIQDRQQATLSSLRISGQLLNAFTITNYPGIDPEIL